MKIFAYNAILALLLFTFLRVYKQQDHGIIDVAARNAALKKLQFYSISCSPDLNFFNPQDSVNNIPLLEGWGYYRAPVTVSNDSAKIYFEQGINMYYGFHIIEALASFSKSTTFDSSFAMGYWGMALAYGPNINNYGYSASPEALVAIQKAKGLGSNYTSLEKELIAPMQLRYTADTTQTREHLNQLYAGAMK